MNDTNQRIAALEREVAELKEKIVNNHETLEGLQQMLLETVLSNLDESTQLQMIESLSLMADCFSPDEFENPASLSGHRSTTFSQAWYYPYWRFWRYLKTFRTPH